MDYTKAVEIFRDTQAKMRPLAEEYRQRMREVYPDETYSTPYDDAGGLMFFADAPSEGARFDFENERAKFYTVMVDGAEVSECVHKT